MKAMKTQRHETDETHEHDRVDADHERYTTTGLPVATQRDMMHQRLLALPPRTVAQGNPPGGVSNHTKIVEATLQGAIHNMPDVGDLPASVDIDRETQFSRDHITPGVWIPLGTYNVVANTPYTIQLPRWCRSVMINNASDLGSAVTLAVEPSGTPANAGSWPVRSGTVQEFAVLGNYISIYCTSNVTINSGLLGSILLKASA